MDADTKPSTPEFQGNQVNYYAHTAEDEQGNRLPETGWQPLAEHLRNVARLAKGFAAALGPSAQAEAELAGLLHDFQTQNQET